VLLCQVTTVGEMRGRELDFEDWRNVEHNFKRQNNTSCVMRRFLAHRPLHKQVGGMLCNFFGINF